MVRAAPGRRIHLGLRDTAVLSWSPSVPLPTSPGGPPAGAGGHPAHLDRDGVAQLALGTRRHPRRLSAGWWHLLCPSRVLSPDVVGASARRRARSGKRPP